ncbi:MAG TPA: sulfotransferase family 2 domain-containing protein [Ideonella sp.]|uniref:sulfotransferase family 2 domain-containing protein n=1 Tax=Ideonella sp. TaxID=1929293 RepID=UPI002C3A93D4|nr:sulfotransferase family 2 domain-containing protein [Ideonella sp.]HSI47153.1 sulfotransferase family 2 domain-containing protein [Ideonella sp.]
MGTEVLPLVSPTQAQGPASGWLEGWDKPWLRSGLRRALVAHLQSLVASNADVVVSTTQGGEDFHQGLVQAAGNAGMTQCLLGWHAPLQRLAALALDRKFLDTERPDVVEQLMQLLRQDRRAHLRLSRVLAGLRVGGLPHHIQPLDEVSAWPRPLQGLRPGLQALLAQEAEWRTRLDQPPSFLQPVLHSQASPDGSVLHVMTSELPPLLHEGDEWTLGGSVVVQGLGAEWRLVMRQGRHWRRLTWHQPSPALAAQFPGAANAAEARFKPVNLPALRMQPTQLLLRRDEPRPDSVTAAEIQFQPLDRDRILGIFLARWSIGYRPLPKVACTSIKEVLFQLVVGEKFSPGVNAGAAHVHQYFDIREQDISHAGWRFVVVRDPIKRFLSGFSNRVLHHKELSRSYVSRQSVDPPLNIEEFPFDPNVNQFIANFEFYRRIPSIDHHFQPISEFLAPLASFDRVYAFEELDQLCRDLSERTGQSIALPHTQRGGPKMSLASLTPESIVTLKKIYAEDYQLLADFYTPP